MGDRAICMGKRKVMETYVEQHDRVSTKFKF